MKINTFFKLFLPVLIITSVTNGQVKTPFNVRYQKTVRGDITMISNSIMRDPNAGGSSANNFPDNGSNGNDGINMQYIDIDGDATTFNSSSANLDITKFPDCSRIKYAGLYWGGTYKYNTNSVVSSGRTEDWNQVKLKVPGGTYVDIIATGTTSGLPTQKIYNGFIDPNQTNVTHSPYSCYADITSLVTSLADPKGNYFVGNIRISKGNNTGLPGGVCGGWTIVIVYEKESLTAKNITTFDGHAVIASNSGSVNIPVNGFQTIPLGPVNAKLGVIAFEGDKSVTGDGLRVAGLSPIVTPSVLQNNLPGTTNNYFNSSTTINGVSTNTTRNPTSLNTLGWDTHLENIPNALNSVIPNNETGATLTATTTGDKYDVFFAAFAVDVIAPDIPLIKTVQNTAGVDISGQTLNIGQTFYYALNFDNIGNDNATAFTIQDVLPTNVVFPTSGGTMPVASDFILPPGVTYTYNPTTKKIIFTIPNSLVTVTPNAPSYTIKIKVRAPGSCNEVVDACANVIINQAFATYTGVSSNLVTTQNGSNTGYNSCNFVVPGPTNYLLNIDNCTFTNSAILCGNSVTLTAANGYTSYQWTNSSGTVIGTTQSISVSAIGTYSVLMSAATPCRTITVVFTVTNFANATTVNPIIPFADEVVICPNDGSQLPKIILCGLNDSQVMQTGINATNIVWEQLNTSSCPPVAIANCANTNTTCTWNQVGTGPNFTATNAGEYRITIYQNGCFKTYYFNVYKNLLNPTITPKNIVCTTQGNITITNISAGYEFSLSATGPFQSSNVFPIATAGTYTVYIRQTGVTNGCLFSFPNISVLSQNFNVNIIKSDKLCNNGYGSINVQINGVNPQYNYQLSQGSTVISTFGPSATNFHVFSNLNPGTYTVTATTTDGCTNTQQITIADLSNLVLNATVSQNISCTQGNIQVNTTGGQPPYNYAIYSYNGVPIPSSNYNFQTSVIFDIQQGQEGFYQFIVVDSNNCTSISNTVEIVLEPAVVTTETHTNVTCFGVSNGTITITATPTNGYNITYSLDAINFQSSNVFTGLAPGTYTITVKYKKGIRECTYPITVTITQPTILQAQSQLTQQLTCTATGTIQTSASGGTSPYQYSINGITFQSSNTFTGLTGGTYTVTVKDSNNCLSLASPINIPIVLPPTDLTFSNTNITCPNLTSNLTATVVGGNSPFTFQIIAPSTINASTTSGSVATFNNLTAGTYTIKVTDSKNCTYQENYTINPITPINVNGTVTSNVKCFGGNTGALSFNVTGFTGTYSYSINNATAITNQTTATISLTNLTIGNYSITVTDTITNCQSTFSLNVTGPASALALSAIPSQPTCVATGSVNAIATGGWGSYQYTLTLPNATTTPPQNSGLFTNLTAVGTYTVKVTDANGCIVTNNFTINSFTNPTIAISPTSTLCYNTTSGATVILTAGGGTPPYQYQIGSGALQSSNTFTNLTPNSYTFNVVDSYGCTASVTQVINPLLVATGVITKNLDCTTSPNATINVSISGGVPAYQYQVKINGGPWSALSAVTGSSFVYSAATAGTYQFRITDFKGCTVITTIFTINPLVQPVITSVTQSQPILCNGNSNGAITINYNNTIGLAPFTINVLNTTTNYNFGTQTTGLPFGSYLITLTDSNLCTDTETITISQPAVLGAQATITQQITCLVNGTIQANNVTGGTSPYQYSLNGVTFQSSNTFTNLAAGSYSITVKDVNNCIVQTNAVTLTTPAPITDLSFTSTAVVCPSLNSNVTVTSTGGVAPFTFQIISPSTINASNTTANVATFNALNTGTYIFKVTDSNGCTYQENFTINPPTRIAVNGSTVSNVSCLGDNNGVVLFNVSGFSTSYSYTVNGGTAVTNQTNAAVTLNNLAAGNYIINVTDTTTNCQSNVTLTVTSPASALGLTKVVSPITCVADGNVVGTATGGWGSYQYTLTLPNASTVGPQISGSFGNLTLTGNYTLSVKDGNNCIATTTFTLTPTVNPVLAVDPSSTLCYNTATGSTVILSVTGGVAPYSYNVDSGTNQSSNTFANLTPGNYTFNVIDSYGCTANVTQTINPLLVATASITKNLDCTASPNATINVAISGGVSAYQYQVKINGGSWSTLSAVTGTSFVYSASTAGTYQFQITDASGCVTITNMVTVNPITNPDIVSLTQTQFNLCNGDSNAAFTINMDPNVGVSPFVFTVLNTTTGVNYGNQTSGLPAGNYTVTVVDANQCTDSASITITQPNPIIFNVNTTDISCTGTGGTNFGEIKVVSVSGGTMPYTYHINNNFGYTDTYNTVTNEDHTFIVLNFGIYHVQVTDANNCVLVGNDIIIASPPNDLDIDVSTPTVSCLTGGTAVITVSTAVLSGSYEFGILTSNSSPYASSFQPSDPGTPETTTFTGLTPGVLYTFVVHDLITNCYYFETAASPILSPSSINATIDAVNNVTCTGSNNGTISFTITGYDVTATSISYEIFNAQSNSATGFSGNSLNTGSTINVTNFATLQPGMYYLLVTENGGANGGCTAATTTFSITQSVILLNANASLIKNDNCNLNAGIVSASAVGGTTPYQYQILTDTATAPTILTWTGASTNNFNVESGNYIVYVKDANNCIQSTPITVGLDLAPTISLSLVDPCVAEGNYVVNVTRTDGVAPFTYSVDGGAAFTENNTAFPISNLSSGAHTVVVTDTNGCTNTQNITIDSIVTGTVTVVQQPSCANNDGQIQATAANGSTNYSFVLQDNTNTTIQGPNSTGLFTALAYGNYTVIVTDTTHNCIINLPIALEQPTAVTFTNSFVNPSCNGNNNGSITVTLDASNNNPPYLYSLNNGITTQSSPIFNNLIAGSYTITVISNRNCSDSQNVTLVDPAVLDVSATATTFACNANNSVNTVTITANATGGTTPYLYSIDGTNYQSATTFSVADTGAVQNLTVYVKDVNSCLDSFPISINPLPVMTNPLVTLNTALTCTNDENVTVTVTGGSGNFNYLLLPSGTPTATNTFNLNAAGSYVFQIIDTTTGCTINTNPYTINPLPILQVQATALSAVNCFGDINGSLSFSVLNYTGNYNYQVFDTVTGLSVTNGSGSTLNSSVTVSGLPAGNFNVVLTETQVPLCTATSNVVTIGSPAIPISLTILQTAPVTCTNNQGTITAQTVGGNGTYEYQLVNTTTGTTIQAYNSNATFTGLSAGNYEVTVRDQNLCTDIKLITLTAPTAISATNAVSNNPLLCYNTTNAFVTVTATGGQGVYQYQLNYPDGITIAGPQISNVFTNLGAGVNYTVTVTDGWNCTFTTLPFTITQPTQIVASLAQQSQLTCTTNAQLLITASGGTPPYRYSTDGINFIPLTATPISVGAGTYHYYITDTNNCTAILTNDILIEPITPLNITLNTSNASINCNGDNTASLSATVVGGLGNYQYSLLNASNAVIQGPQAGSNFTGLGIGTYSIKVTSGDCIITSSPFTITQPPAIDLTNAVTVTNITCHGEKNGSITINVAGGTPLFQYAISPNMDQTSNVSTFNNLDVGSYDVLIQDANGCYRVITAQITEPAELTSSITSVTQELCEGNDDGSITIAINGGTPPYFTSLNNENNYVQGQLTYNGLSGGQTYIIYVKDSKECKAPLPITMNTPVTLSPVLNNIVYDCTTTANPLNNTVTVSGISATLQPFVTYSLDNQTSYQSNNVYTNLANGNHIIYIKHTNGCVKQLPFTITNYLPLQGTLTSVDVLCNGSNTGSLTVSGLSGGSGSYQYAISPNYVYGTASTFPNLVAGIYIVKVKDTNNCELTLNRTITESTPIVVTNVSISQENCIGDNNGSITISISGGVGPYSTSFNNQTNFVAGQVVFPNLSGGQTYTIYVKDALGCILPHPVTLNPPVDMHTSAFTSEVCINNVNTTQVTIQVDQLYINDVLYSINGVNFQQSNIFTNLAPGNYTGYVLHNLGCSSITAPFTINPISQLSLTAVESGLNQITATATFGSPPYTYYFNGEYQGANNAFMFYQSGVQTIKVIDNSGCEKIVLLPATFYDIEIPNYFTPDGNNHNDGWSPRKIDNFQNIKTKIFDRYGRVIKILSLGETWDGTYNNETLPSGDYWYLVEVNDNSGRTFVGNFTLYR